MTTMSLMRVGRLSSAYNSALASIVLVGALFLVVRCCPAQESAAKDNVTNPGGQDSLQDSLVDDQLPVTDRERELMDLIRNLQDRVSKLEAAQAAKTNNKPATSPGEATDETAASASSIADNTDGVAPENISADAIVQATAKSTEPEQRYGRYTPNFGYKVANTEHGDMGISIYSYVRYLNQLATADTYTDSFGNTKNVQQRQDFQLQKLQIKFLGWVLSPRLRYFLYGWTSNATMGQGAQVVLAGNLNFLVNKHFTFSGGIFSLPGVRTTEGNFPFWFSVDSRHMADEFFRPSYTDGIKVSGDITDKLSYQAMLGNNLSVLGVSALQLDPRPDTFSGALVWMPRGDYGLGYGDFENHQSLVSRWGAHYSHSTETKQNQPSTESFENTQIRLSDGTVIFTPDLFGQGTTVNSVRYQMTSFDGGLKYRGFSLEGEYYMRWLNNFKGSNIAALKPLFDHGFQLQGSTMLIPQKLQLYIGASRINGQFGKPWDFRTGLNFFPYKNKVFRVNGEMHYLHNSPVGYSSVPYFVGARGPIFDLNWELAF